MTTKPDEVPVVGRRLENLIMDDQNQPKPQTNGTSGVPACKYRYLFLQLTIRNKCNNCHKLAANICNLMYCISMCTSALCFGVGSSKG